MSGGISECQGASVGVPFVSTSKLSYAVRKHCHCNSNPHVGCDVNVLPPHVGMTSQQGEQSQTLNGARGCLVNDLLPSSRLSAKGGCVQWVQTTHMEGLL